MTAPRDDQLAANKREGERFPILGELHGEVMLFQPMTIREISRAGVQLETSFPLQLNSLHDFRLTLGSRSIVIKGRVAHCSISDVDQEVVVYRLGVEFIEPSERVSAVIHELIGEMTGGARTTAPTTEPTTGSSSPSRRGGAGSRRT